MGKKYHSDICMGIYESVKELLDRGAISEAELRENLERIRTLNFLVPDQIP